MDGIRIVVLYSGKKKGSDYYSHSCMFFNASKCEINGIECNYGLTEIRVPKKCPLRKEVITKSI